MSVAGKKLYILEKCRHVEIANILRWHFQIRWHYIVIIQAARTRTTFENKESEDVLNFVNGKPNKKSFKVLKSHQNWLQ